MAIIKTEDKQIELPDDSSVKETCKELGIVFGCEDGRCGTCTTNVLEGMENLLPKNEKEQDMDLDNNERLMCQCKIKSGEIKINQH